MVHESAQEAVPETQQGNDFAWRSLELDEIETPSFVLDHLHGETALPLRRWYSACIITPGSSVGSGRRVMEYAATKTSTPDGPDTKAMSLATAWLRRPTASDFRRVLLTFFYSCGLKDTATGQGAIAQVVQFKQTPWSSLDTFRAHASRALTHLH